MKKILLCVLSAILIILSFPKTSFWPLAWISLVPLFIAVKDEKPQKSFLYGIFTGIVAYCGILYWIVPMFSAAGESKVIGISVLLLLSLYLALYYGVFCFCSSLITYHLSLITAFIWISLEFIRTHLFTGFPWALLGYSQWNFLPIIQISEFTGVYGVSFLIVLVNLTIVEAIKNSKLRVKNYGFTLLLISVSLIFGFYKLKNPIILKPYNSKTVSILQGNIDQYKKWDAKYEEEIMNTYSLLVTRHIGRINSPLQLIIWPESATPGYLRHNKKISRWIQTIARKTKTQHLIGSNDFKNNKNYNSAFLISGDGKILDEYSKNHLVPFGEFMPLRNFLGKFIKVVNEIGEFSSGEKYNVINSSVGKLGVNICFEAIFPNEIRKSVKNGADIIVNITNDAWYLKTSAPYQHFTMNVFRAVENRRELVRAANTGISGFIDARGRIKSKTEIFTKTVITDSVVQCNNLTTYTRFGDFFSYFAIILSTILLTFRKKFDKLQ